MFTRQADAKTYGVKRLARLINTLDLASKVVRHLTPQLLDETLRRLHDELRYASNPAVSQPPAASPEHLEQLLQKLLAEPLAPTDAEVELPHDQCLREGVMVLGTR